MIQTEQQKTIDQLIKEAPQSVEATIQISGQEVGLLFNAMALAGFLQRGAEYKLGSDTMTIGHLVNIIYSGMVTHNYLNETKGDLTLKDVYHAVTEKLTTKEGFGEMMQLHGKFLSCRSVIQLLKNETVQAFS